MCGYACERDVTRGCGVGGVGYTRQIVLVQDR